MAKRQRKPAAPPLRKATRRQEIISLLATGTYSVRDISGTLGMAEKEAVHHLQHIDRSLRGAGERLEMTPASCRLCGFTFRSRVRLTVPGKCPKCRKGSIDAPTFSVSAGGKRGK